MFLSDNVLVAMCSLVALVLASYAFRDACFFDFLIIFKKSDLEGLMIPVMSMSQLYVLLYTRQY